MKFAILLLGSLWAGLVTWFSPTNAPQPDVASSITTCGGMVAFVDDPTFQAAHPYVRPIPAQPQAGEMIKLDVAGGPQANAYLIKSSQPTDKYLFVIHEWWGLNDNIKAEADKYFEALGNVHVIALDMYDGKLATTPEDAGKYMQGLDQDRAKAIVGGAIAFAGESAQIATIGWCFGGGWSLKTALQAGTQTIGCVIYYGMPVQEVDQLKTLNSDVLGIFALQDRWINPEVVATFQQNMLKAEKSIDVHSFDAAHGFSNPSGARYDKEAAEVAYDLALAYLGKRFDR